jgi:hypothetical protein
MGPTISLDGRVVHSVSSRSRRNRESACRVPSCFIRAVLLVPLVRADQLFVLLVPLVHCVRADQLVVLLVPLVHCVRADQLVVLLVPFVQGGVVPDL